MTTRNARSPPEMKGDIMARAKEVVRDEQAEIVMGVGDSIVALQERVAELQAAVGLIEKYLSEAIVDHGYKARVLRVFKKG
jgi:hypothetical protein